MWACGKLRESGGKRASGKRAPWESARLGKARALGGWGPWEEAGFGREADPGKGRPREETGLGDCSHGKSRGK